jgi:hypothetical protein
MPSFAPCHYPIRSGRQAAGDLKKKKKKKKKIRG